MNEFVVDLREQGDENNPVFINGATVEMVNSFKFPGIHIFNNLTWSRHTNAVFKKAHKLTYLFLSP